MNNEKEILLGINNYCLNYHTMNDTKSIFSLLEYELTKKSLLNENLCLTNNNFFKYEKWLTRE